MSWRTFLKYLFILSLLTGLWAFGVSGMGTNTNTVWIYVMGISSFVVFSILIFLYAYNTSASDKLFSFNNVVTASFLVKMLMSIGLLMLYEKIFNPNDKMHIFHFILMYFIYTIFEVYFLTKLAKSSE